MIYHEDGWIAEVEVLKKENKTYGNSKGEKMTLKVIQTLQNPRYIEPECVPKSGDEFSVWRAHNAGAYAGWDLSEY